MREQFLVEITGEPDVVGRHHVADLAELNRLFAAWVETQYHRTVHSETGQTPAGAPVARSRCPPRRRSPRRSCGRSIAGSPRPRPCRCTATATRSTRRWWVTRWSWCSTCSPDPHRGPSGRPRSGWRSRTTSGDSVIYLPDPTVGVRGIHHRIVASLGGQPLTHHATLAPQAADALAAEHAERGRTPVLVIEESHLLGHDQLEAIRLLTNHDLDSSSPFACLLVGQPTLRRRMKLGVLAALDQRIGLRYTMPPMTDKETGSYLRHHLALAGRDDTLFSDDAVALVHQTSRGYPRAVNNLALQALVAASPPTRPSSTNPPPAQPLPRSRQTEHHPDTPNTTDPAGRCPAGSLHARTSSPSMPPSCSS